MITIGEFTKREYGQKLYKLSLSAGFGCPNRVNNQKGCIFCSESGSGDFAVDVSFLKNTDTPDPHRLDECFMEAKSKIASKYSGDKFIAYFQAFTNTYAPIEELRRVFIPIINRDDVAVLSIATRPDCLSEETYMLLKELTQIKPVWVELGLQTTKEATACLIRRGYENNVYNKAIQRLNELGIHTITHVILFLPGETKEDMLNTVKHVINVGSGGIKLQMLQVLEGTDLALEYKKHPFTIPTLTEYTDMVKECLNIIDNKSVIHRLTGDPPRKLLIEPIWATDKKRILNYLQKREEK